MDNIENGHFIWLFSSREIHFYRCFNVLQNDISMGLTPWASIKYTFFLSLLFSVHALNDQTLFVTHKSDCIGKRKLGIFVGYLKWWLSGSINSLYQQDIATGKETIGKMQNNREMMLKIVSKEIK